MKCLEQSDHENCPASEFGHMIWFCIVSSWNAAQTYLSSCSALKLKVEPIGSFSNKNISILSDVSVENNLQMSQFMSYGRGNGLGWTSIFDNGTWFWRAHFTNVGFSKRVIRCSAKFIQLLEISEIAACEKHSCIISGVDKVVLNIATKSSKCVA